RTKLLLPGYAKRTLLNDMRPLLMLRAEKPSVFVRSSGRDIILSMVVYASIAVRVFSKSEAISEIGAISLLDSIMAATIAPMVISPAAAMNVPPMMIPLMDSWVSVAVTLVDIDCSHLMVFCVSDEARTVASQRRNNWPS